MNIWTSTNNFKKLYSLPSVSEQVTSQSSFHAYWIRNKTSEAERSTPLHDIFTLFSYSDKFQGLPERLLRRFASFASYPGISLSHLLHCCLEMDVPWWKRLEKLRFRESHWQLHEYTRYSFTSATNVCHCKYPEYPEYPVYTLYKPILNYINIWTYLDTSSYTVYNCLVKLPLAESNSICGPAIRHVWYAIVWDLEILNLSAVDYISFDRI